MAGGKDLILRSIAKRCVSKDGCEFVCCIHPSRRGQAAAPPAITAKPLRGDEDSQNRPRMAETSKFTLAECLEPGYSPEIAPNAASLDFWGRAAITAQPLGSPSGSMRNKITKLIIVVVPRRTAGDG
jgi:hypothetical protein